MRAPAWSVGVILFAIAAGCGGGEPEPTLASGTTSSASVSTTPATTEAESPGPTPSTEGEGDFGEIWRRLVEYHNWAFQNPELADLGAYLSPACECYSVARATLDEYVANGWHEISPGLIIDSVEVGEATGSAALLTVIDEHSALLVVDDAGNVVLEREPRPKMSFDVRLTLTEDGWRIAEWLRRGAVEDGE